MGPTTTWVVRPDLTSAQWQGLCNLDKGRHRTVLDHMGESRWPPGLTHYSWDCSVLPSSRLQRSCPWTSSWSGPLAGHKGPGQGGCQGPGQASVLDTQRTGPGPRALSARPLPEARPVGLCLWPQGGPYWLVRVQGARCREVEGREAGVWTPQPPCSNLLSCTLASTGASPFVCSRICYYSSYIPISCVETELKIVPKL